jgi:hypothetical protein
LCSYLPNLHGVQSIIITENGTVNGPKDMSSVKLSSELRNWQTLTWAEYIKYDTTKLVESNFVSENDLFFKAIIIRGHGKIFRLMFFYKYSI